jgi:hypothetical protein
MKKLDDDWITKGILDFEYKKYMLLAYLHYVEQSFDQQKLYPPFSDLIAHYRNVSTIKDGKSKLLQSFPKRLSHLDLKNFKMFFETIIQDDENANELEEILNFSLNQMKDQLNVGQNIYDAVDKQLVIESVGVKALKDDEGLLLIDLNYDPFYYIYKYKVSIFETAHEKVRGLQTDFIQKIRKTIGTTIEQLKLNIIRNMHLITNLSTFRVVSLDPYPFNETLLPVVKRSFSAYLYR